MAREIQGTASTTTRPEAHERAGHGEDGQEPGRDSCADPEGVGHARLRTGQGVGVIAAQEVGHVGGQHGEPTRVDGRDQTGREREREGASITTAAADG